ncbi:MAG: hypothetical protein NWS14_00135 [Pontimonas sp.]|jgi:hypothetical protein|nr:hypothetical protein [Pontimonas sp.]|tara:strand:+ start:1943 stop:2080 length:138 start_codon:yes stop_codon:yes gene_type:complete
MTAALLQALGLIGLPVSGFLVADVGGGMIGLSLALVYAGLALETR